MRGGHSRRGSGDKKILGGGLEAVIAIAAVTEDHQRIKGDGELKETLDARDILFDSSDEAKKGDVMGEREGKRGFGEAVLNKAALYLARALKGQRGLMGGLHTSCIAAANSGLWASQLGIQGRLPLSVTSGVKHSSTGR